MVETRGTALLTVKAKDLILRSSAKRYVSMDGSPNCAYDASAFISR
jgi:hypothetical protein